MLGLLLIMPVVVLEVILSKQLESSNLVVLLLRFLVWLVCQSFFIVIDQISDCEINL